MKERKYLVENIKLMSKMKRKASDWPTKSTIKSSEVKRFPVFTDKEVYREKILPKSSPEIMDFIKNMPQWFVLKTQFGDFLIDTEDYNYARYVGRIK
jgi:hypothetical protein